MSDTPEVMSKHAPAHGNTFSPEELRTMVDKMRAVTAAFYPTAVRIGNHAFIEFTGLLGEYVKMCDRAASAGMDYTLCNVHTGQALPMQDYEAAYLAEKWECIFGPTLASDPALGRAFVAGILGEDWRDVLGVVDAAPARSKRKAPAK